MKTETLNYFIGDISREEHAYYVDKNQENKKED